MLEMNATIKKNITAEKPETPDFESDYEGLLEKYNITDLEDSLNDLTAQEDELQAAYDTQVAAERDKPVDAIRLLRGGQARKAAICRKRWIKLPARKTRSRTN